MAEPLVSCPACAHPVRKHSEQGCMAGLGTRFESCWCTRTPAEINPPDPPVDEPEPFRLPPPRSGDEDLAPDLPEPVDLDERAEVVRPKRRGRPPRTGAAAYAKPGDVLGTWYPWSCQSCGTRRFESFYCCDRPAEAVTLTMTRGHGG